MSKRRKHPDCLLIPSESPPDETTIKKQLVLFDRVLLGDPADEAFINTTERSMGKTSGAEVFSAPTTYYPRDTDYADTFSELKDRLTGPLHREKVLILPSRMSQSLLDPLIPLYGAAVSQTDFVTSAIPDYSNTSPPDAPLKSGLITPLQAIFAGDLKMQFASLIPQPARVGQASNDGRWEFVAYGRLACTIKYLEHARSSKAFPFSTSDATDAIFKKLLSIGQGQYLSQDIQEIMRDLAISLDLFDDEKLEAVLSAMSWKDVFELRRKVLPVVSEFRETTLSSPRRFRPEKGSVGSLDHFRKEIESLKRSLSLAQEKAHDSVVKLGFAGVLRGSAGVAGGGVTSALASMVVPGITWEGIMLSCVSGLVVAGGTLASQISDYYMTRKKLHHHPLFGLSKLLPV